MDGKVAFGCGRVVADLTPVWLVTTGVGLSSGQTRMLLACDAVNAGGLTFWMFFLHMNLQCLLVLVMPVTLGTFERLA